MADPDMFSHEHDEMDECVAALSQVHSFLRNELLEHDADLIRLHLTPASDVWRTSRSNPPSRR